MTDLTKSSYEQLFGLLKASNGLEGKVDISDVEFVEVRSLLSHSTGKNTIAVVTGRESSRFRGTEYVYFNRMSLNKLSTRTKETVIITDSDRDYEVLNAINQLYRCNLGTVDVTVTIFGMGGSPRKTIQLIAKDSSLAWIGELNIAARLAK